MPTPQREPLRAITAAEQTALQRIVSADTERVDRVRRAAAVLAVADGKPFIHAAQLAGLRSGTTVADLVERFNRRGLAALTIAAGRGRKPTYAPGDRARIVATAQRTPNRRADETATWSWPTCQTARPARLSHRSAPLQSFLTSGTPVANHMVAVLNPAGVAPSSGIAILEHDDVLVVMTR